MGFFDVGEDEEGGAGRILLTMPKALFLWPMMFAEVPFLIASKLLDFFLISSLPN